MKNPEDKINILHLRDSGWLTGPSRTILETASHIDQNRYNYIIGAFTGKSGKDNSLIEAAVKRGLKTFPIKEAGRFDINVFRQIMDYIKNNNIEIIHTHEFRSDFIGLICAKKLKITIITTLHGWIPNSFKYRAFAILNRALLKFFDRIIVVSEKMKEQILKIGVPREKVIVLQNAIISESYQHNPDDKSFRQELGLDQKTTLVGNIGRLSSEKGQADFILAAKEVLQYHDNMKFVLVGDGDDRQDLENLVNEKGLRQNIIFTGYRTDMKCIYNSLDLVVQTSYTEGMPNVLLEALLMKVPVIATDVGGTSEIILENRTGILINSGDKALLAIRIREYVNSPCRYKAMAGEGRKYIKQNFSFLERTRKLQHLYESINGGPSK